MSNKNTPTHSGAARLLALILSVLVASGAVTIVISLLVNALSK